MQAGKSRNATTKVRVNTCKKCGFSKNGKTPPSTCPNCGGLIFVMNGIKKEVGGYAS